MKKSEQQALNSLLNEMQLNEGRYGLKDEMHGLQYYIEDNLESAIAGILGDPHDRKRDMDSQERELLKKWDAFKKSVKELKDVVHNGKW